MRVRPGVETIILLRVFDILDIDTKPGYILGFLNKNPPLYPLFITSDEIFHVILSHYFYLFFFWRTHV